MNAVQNVHNLSLVRQQLIVPFIILASSGLSFRIVRFCYLHARVNELVHSIVENASEKNP